MGQAKRRGTYEERKTMACEDNALVAKLLLEQEQSWYESLTPEEQIAVKIKRAKEAKVLASIGNVEAVHHIFGGVPFQN
jgi:hypothetical protein